MSIWGLADPHLGQAVGKAMDVFGPRWKNHAARMADHWRATVSGDDWVLVPGDMGRFSYVLVGLPGAMEHTFGSSCHGAGRRMSRGAAIRASKGRSIHRELLDRGVFARARGRTGLEEEQPDAYKDVNQVVDVLHNAQISRKVARLRPIGVIKG